MFHASEILNLMNARDTFLGMFPRRKSHRFAFQTDSSSFQCEISRNVEGVLFKTTVHGLGQDCSFVELRSPSICLSMRQDPLKLLEPGAECYFKQHLDRSFYEAMAKRSCLLMLYGEFNGIKTIRFYVCARGRDEFTDMKR